MPGHQTKPNKKLLICCFSHSAYSIGCQSEKKYFTRWPVLPCSWSAEQGKENKRKSLAAPPPPPPTLLVRRNKNKNHVTRLQGLRRSRSVSRPHKDSFDSSTRPKRVASKKSTLPYAITTFLVSLLLSSPGDVWPRLPLLSSTRP